MENIHDAIQRIEKYAVAANTTPSGVCRAATGNPRLFDRMKRRVEVVLDDVARIEKHMQENPVDGFDVAPLDGGK